MMIVGPVLAQVAFAQNFIHVNQVGYRADGPKVAMFSDLEADEFAVRDAVTDAVVYDADVSAGRRWNASGEIVQFADFSNFKRTGKFYIQVGGEKSFPFVISDSTVYDSLAVWSQKAFYLWRASAKIETEYATFKGVDYSRPLGHPDTMVFLHRDVSSENRHAESVLASPKGWYDSDFSKYVVTAAFSVHSMLSAYVMFPEYFNTQNMNIPESCDSLPDILNELKWELDWLLTMQEPYDGSVYCKVSTLRFSDLMMPHKDDADRFMIGRSTAAALDFAAVTAMASRVFEPFDSITKDYSKVLLKASLKAWNWAEKNPGVVFSNPKDVTTGDLVDVDTKDEVFWAASELLLTTGERRFYDKLDFFSKFSTPAWNNVNGLGLLSMLVSADRLPKFVEKEQIRRKFKSLSDIIYKQYYHSAGKIPLKKFDWGSNGTVAMNGVLLGVAAYKLDKTAYKEGAQACLDYLLGRNSTDYCFVTGFGSKSPMNLHDRRSYSDGIEMPVPGCLVGGPNSNQVMDCGRSNYPSLVYPARIYLDESCSYSTNEVAINWNAPFVWLVNLVRFQ